MFSPHHRIYTGSIGALAIALALTVLGCTSSRARIAEHPLLKVAVDRDGAQVERRWSWRISADRRWYFAYPQLSNAEGAMPRLSHQLAELIQREASVRLQAAEVAPVASSLAEARAYAAKAGYDFFISLGSVGAENDASRDIDPVYWLDHDGNLVGTAVPLLYARVFDLRSGRLLDTLRISPSRRTGWDAPILDTEAAVDALLTALIAH